MRTTSCDNDGKPAVLQPRRRSEARSRGAWRSSLPRVMYGGDGSQVCSFATVPNAVAACCYSGSTTTLLKDPHQYTRISFDSPNSADVVNTITHAVYKVLRPLVLTEASIPSSTGTTFRFTLLIPVSNDMDILSAMPILAAKCWPLHLVRVVDHGERIAFTKLAVFESSPGS